MMISSLPDDISVSTSLSKKKREIKHFLIYNTYLKIKVFHLFKKFFKWTAFHVECFQLQLHQLSCKQFLSKIFIRLLCFKPGTLFQVCSECLQSKQHIPVFLCIICRLKDFWFCRALAKKFYCETEIEVSLVFSLNTSPLCA